MPARIVALWITVVGGRSRNIEAARPSLGPFSCSTSNPTPHLNLLADLHIHAVAPRQTLGHPRLGRVLRNLPLGIIFDCQTAGEVTHPPPMNQETRWHDEASDHGVLRAV